MTEYVAFLAVMVLCAFIAGVTATAIVWGTGKMARGIGELIASIIAGQRVP